MNNTAIAAIIGMLIGAIVCIPIAVEIKANAIEKACFYDNRLVFNGKVFSCNYMKGVEMK